MQRMGIHGEATPRSMGSIAKRMGSTLKKAAGNILGQLFKIKHSKKKKSAWIFFKKLTLDFSKNPS